MVARTDDYRPLLISEHLQRNDIGKLTLCRAASLLMGVCAATNGEFVTNVNGTTWGKAKIKSALNRMMKATGDASRDGYNQSHMDDFLVGLGFDYDAWSRFNRPFDDIIEKLKNRHVVFLAGDVKHTPANSPLRKYVDPNIGHEIILVSVNKAGDRIRFIDPMTPHGTKKYLRSAPIKDFRLFGSEFKANNDFIAGIMRKGYYTLANTARRQAQAEINSVPPCPPETDCSSVEAQLTEANTRIDAVRAAVS
jgi:hypothetical protein